MESLNIEKKNYSCEKKRNKKYINCFYVVQFSFGAKIVRESNKSDRQGFEIGMETWETSAKKGSRP